MKKSIVFLFHAGYWICYFFLALFFTMIAIGIIFYSGEEEPEIAVEYVFVTFLFLTLIPPLISFYLFYWLLFPRYLQQEKIKLSIFYGAATSIIVALFALTIVYYAYGECSEQTEAEYFVLLFVLVSFISFLSGIMALVIRGFMTWYEEIKLKEALQQKNQEMELALLKAQLDPHFLFNTINNIDVLLLRNAAEGSNYLNKLSDIMRFMLFETKTEEISLAQEVEYIEKYISLQKIRTSNEQYINFEVIGTPEGKVIAPMIFIPFIENAFKHTTNKKLENAINIKVKIEEKSIGLECENKFDESRKLDPNSNGLGNKLIQKRLNLIYPNQHTLQIVNQNELYRVHLTIRHE